jgi:hypothetical protein
MNSRSRFVRNAVIATIAGAAVGGTAGLLSVRNPSTVARDPARAAVAAVVQPVPVATHGLADPPPARPAAAPWQTRSSDGRGVTVTQRAQELAARADVNGLLALRDAVTRRADDRGEQKLDSIKRELTELDRYLTEARALRLKFDGNELRGPGGSSNGRQ